MKLKKIGIAEMAEPARVKVELELLSGEPVNEPVNHKCEPVNEPVSARDETVNCESILHIIRENGDVSYDELAKLCRCSRSTIRRRIEELKSQNRIVHVGADKNGHWVVNESI